MEVDDVEEEEFGFSRNYFLSKELTGSSKKSASKLSDIDLVSEQDLIEAASNIVPKHEKETFTLLNSYKSLYSKWRFELRCGFGLMMYGFGSKKSLLEDFASVSLEDVGVVVINGYLPSVNVKHATVAMAEVLWSQMKANQSVCSVICPNLKQPFDSQSMEDLLAFLDGSHSKDKEGFICVIIHNIDGPGLRDSETQHHLAQVAQCSHVRIVASIDHVNAPLLWDKKMVHIQFNWCWYHVPTFAPYKAESIFCPLILTNTGHTQTAKTAAIVLQSLTPNAQSVFKVLAQYQMAHSDEEGLLVSSLYNMCRECFLVSSQLTLNAHLTEFKDHNLVRTRRHSDGGDCLYIPLTSDVLKKLVQEIA